LESVVWTLHTGLESFEEESCGDLAQIMSSFRLGLIQLAVGVNKAANIQRACDKVKEAVANGANVVSLPECFNSPYGTKYFPEYAESVPDGETCLALGEVAKSAGTFLIGGSIPEKDGNNLYNTLTVWNPQGQLVQTHRKMHLFDIDIPGKITFKESDVLSPGNDFSTVDTPYCKIGLGICYDIRFADLAQIYSRDFGCKLLVYPGAFNMTTGPAHWELLARARAIDNQVYVASVSPARNEGSDYVAYGHSLVVNPFAEVIARTEAAEDIIYADIDIGQLEERRSQIPVQKQRRTELYEVKKLV